MTIDRETLMAYSDGELDELTRRRVEQAIAADPALARQVEADRTLRARISGHYAGAVDRPVPDRLRALLDTNVHDIADARAGRTTARRLIVNAAALAATLVVGVFVGQGMSGRASGPVGMRDGAVVAQGKFAQALDTQLASAQPADATTRIGISFRNVDGDYCRTFQVGGLDGLACRSASRWTLRNMASAGAKPASEYRQASSADPAILTAAQEMMAGDPLDAAAEAAARDRGWR